MEKALKELQDRIAKLEAKVNALPSPAEFAALKSDVELIKSESAPRATSTAEAALRVAYDMKEELFEKVDTRALNALRDEIESLKGRERFVAPEQAHIKKVIAYLRRKQDIFNPQVIVRSSTNDWYEIMKQPDAMYMFVSMSNTPVVDLVLKDPVQVNGVTLFRPLKDFKLPVQISLGEVPFEPTHTIDIPKPYLTDPLVILRNDFETRMVRWVRIELKEIDSDYQHWMIYNLELHSPDPAYADGVFRTLGQRNQDMRRVCQFSVHENNLLHGKRDRIRTCLENAPWVEAEIVHGKLKITGYSISWGSPAFPGWTLRCSNDRNLPIENWEVLHRYVIGSQPISLLDVCGIKVECKASKPMKYFRVVADALPDGKLHALVVRFDVNGTLCPE